MCECVSVCVSMYVSLCLYVCGNIFLPKLQTQRQGDAAPPAPPPFSFSFAHFIPFSLHYFCHFRLAAAFLCTALSFPPPPSLHASLHSAAQFFLSLCVFFLCARFPGTIMKRIAFKEITMRQPQLPCYLFSAPLHCCLLGCPSSIPLICPSFLPFSSAPLNFIFRRNCNEPSKGFPPFHVPSTALPRPPLVVGLTGMQLQLNSCAAASAVAAAKGQRSALG